MHLMLFVCVCCLDKVNKSEEKAVFARAIRKSLNILSLLSSEGWNLYEWNKNLSKLRILLIVLLSQYCSVSQKEMRQ